MEPEIKIARGPRIVVAPLLGRRDQGGKILLWVRVQGWIEV